MKTVDQLPATAGPYSDYVTADEISAELGNKNWVVTRKTPRILAKYGDNVLCISRKRLYEVENAVRARRKTNMETAVQRLRSPE